MVAVNCYHPWEKFPESCRGGHLERKRTQQPEVQGTEHTDLPHPSLPLTIPLAKLGGKLGGSGWGSAQPNLLRVESWEAAEGGAWSCGELSGAPQGLSVSGALLGLSSWPFGYIYPLANARERLLRARARAGWRLC